MYAIIKREPVLHDTGVEVARGVLNTIFHSDALSDAHEVVGP